MQENNAIRCDDSPNFTLAYHCPDTAAGAAVACSSADTESWRTSESWENISHEIRTPLHGIMGIAEVLSNTELTLEQRTSIRLLWTSAGSVLQAAENLLDFSLLDAGKIALARGPFDLEEVLGDLFRTLDGQARHRGLRLRFQSRQDVPFRLTGDSLRLRQVITNLVANAIKFTHAGQISLTVSLEARFASAATLHFAVSDTGIGIPKDRQSSIFQAFSQVDRSNTRSHGGTGLGLCIAAQLVALMEGEIWVDSVLDRGSCFHFTAKFGLRGAVAAPAAPVKCLNPPTPPDPFRRGTILLAEDNYINQVVTVHILERHGHRVLVGANGRLALDILEQEPVDLILMDIQMPEMDGFQATRLIREREQITGAHLPIVALTAHALQGYRQKCLDAGMDDYLSKPFRGEDLLEVVNRTLGNRTLVNRTLVCSRSDAKG